MSVFVSYARLDDEQFAARVADALRAQGTTVWRDRDDMPSGGRPFRQELREAIAAVDRLVLVVGPVAAGSPQVRAEWQQALETCTPVVVLLRLGDEDLIPLPLAGPHWIDARAPRSEVETLAELERIVAEPVPPLGRVIGADASPEHIVRRVDDEERLSAAVLADLRGPEVLANRRRVTALSGMGGVGKSVLAADFARSCAVRWAFPDGIAWVRLGQAADVISAMRVVGRAFGDRDDARYATADDAEGALSVLLADAARLLVLDDVWELGAVEPFARALGPSARVLFTTREGHVATALAAQEVRLDVLEAREARALLASWLEGELGPHAEAVLEECGRLPLAIALCGAMGRDGVGLEHLVAALREADIGFLDASLSGYAYPGVMRALQASVDRLAARNGTAARDRYLELAVLPSGAHVPTAAVAALWRHTGDLRDRDVARLLAVLERASLLRRDGDRVALHDLQHDYVAAVTPDPPTLHAAMVDAYGAACAGDWAAGPDDGYYFEELPRHLHEAERDPQLRALLTDTAWLEAKLAATGPARLATDFDLAPGLELVRQAVELSAHVLAREPSQLAAQLRGRLDPATAPGLEPLITGAVPRLELWLRPVRASLTNAGQPLVRTLDRHTNAVLHVAMNSDGTRAVSGGLDDAEILWNLRTGAARVLPADGDAMTQGIAWTSDGRAVVTSRWDGTARVWNGDDGSLFHALPASPDGGGAVAISPDDRHLVRGDGAGRVTCWDLHGGAMRWQTAAHANAVCAIAVAPDGEALVSGSEDGTLAVLSMTDGRRSQTLGVALPSTIFNEFETPDGSVVATRHGSDWIVMLRSTPYEPERLPGHTRSITAIALGPDVCATAAYDDTVRLWDRATGRELHVLRHEGSVYDLALAGADRLVGACADHALRVWDARTGRLDCTLEGHTDAVTAVAVTTDGRTAVSASSDWTLRVWDLERELQTLVLRGHTAAVRTVTPSSTGRYVLSGANDATVRLWDLSRPDSAPEGHRGRVNAVALSADGRLAVTGGGTQVFKVEPDPTVRLWDTATARMRAVLGTHRELVTAVGVSRDGRRAVSGSEDGGIRSWDLGRETLLHELGTHGKRVEDVQLARDGRFALSGGHDGVVRLWDLDTASCRYELRGHEEWVNRVRFLADDRNAVSTSKDGTVRVWDLATGDLRRTWRSSGSDTYALAVSPDGTWVASGNVDGAVVLWHVVSGARVVAAEAHTGPVTALLVMPDGSRLISASGYGDGTLRAWHLDGSSAAVMRGHTAYVVNVVALDGGRIASAAHDGTIRVWDVDSGRQLAAFAADSNVDCLAAHPGGLLVAGESTGHVHVLRLEAGRGVSRDRS